MHFEQGVLNTLEKFIKANGELLLGALIWHLIGPDEGAARSFFAEIMADSTLNIQQIRFIEEIIKYFIVNGIAETDRLFEVPFTDIHSVGIMGLFDKRWVYRIIELIERVNQNVVVDYIFLFEPV